MLDTIWVFLTFLKKKINFLIAVTLINLLNGILKFN